MSEINFIDGQQLTPTDFGELDPYTNKWVPKAYSGSYGTNGFFLEFGDSAALGDDTSGNGNDFTSSGLTADDQVTDSPTDNFCTLSSIAEYGTSGSMGIADGNLFSSPGGVNTNKGWRSTFSLPSGKWYFETTFNQNNTGNNVGVGVGEAGVVPGETATSVRWMDNPSLRQSAVGVTYGTAITSGDILNVAIDVDAGKVWFGLNGTWFASGDPAAGTSESASGLTSLPLVVSSYHYTNAGTTTFDFGQLGFTYTPPTGFVALSTDNLPSSEAGIAAFVWIKNRDAVDNHMLFDRVRGVGNDVHSNSTNAEVSNPNTLQSFLINGFQIGSDVEVNTANEDYVAWQWMTGTTGTGTSNTDGSITSTVLADTTAGFSIVSYTGNGTAGATVGHGLGVAPQFIAIKSRTYVESWGVYPGTSTGYGGQYRLKLNETSSVAAASGFWNNTDATSSVFSLGTELKVNKSGENHVAYCWAEVAGYSKIGRYTGNGSTDGPFVWTGFKPIFIMTKRTDSTSDWTVWDGVRNGFNPADDIFRANTTAAEASNFNTDFTSNGWKLRDAGANQNASGGTYIYMAFAEHPFGGTGVAPATAR
jgi:hypothetical protein